ncbi:hypothetical protein B9Z55_016364 [Caenorhabditis nigoni]|uniref:7TM GPCR serpentine receptor class x (Srx) domain-containing protein n=1 Tax=Caenorhabditis nigoni TaxID=1611254 RepID=A0A2G5T576_9PELO|nr:hypothetical protein B9Z55_016364 [Caenorhabditis nigoni]
MINNVTVGCGYIYDPNLFVWRTEFHDCSKRLAVIFPFVILGTTIATNAFNVAIGTRLLAMKLIGVKEEEAKERRRRWMVMFIQVTSFGTIANVLVFLAARRMSSMSSSFGIITKNQAVCNTVMCVIFLCYVCPMQLR